MDFSKIKYTVTDLETSVNCPPNISGSKALPSWPENKSVLTGLLINGQSPTTTTALSKISHSDHSVLIVGQHIMFDLQYIKKENPALYLAIVRNDKIWDTAIAEYCMSAQEHLYPSLNDLATKYGGVVKDDKIKAYWDSGVKTEDIPKSELVPYCITDLKNTELVFRKQFEECATNNKQLTRLILSQGNTALACADMMANGMAVDVPELERQEEETRRKIAYIEGYIKGIVLLFCSIPTFLDHKIDPYSNVFMSKAFFGGKLKYKDTEPAGFYKNGKPKTKVIEKELEVKPFDEIPDGVTYKVANKQGFSVDDDVLRKIAKSTHRNASRVAQELIKLRTLSKDLNTYILPIKEKSFRVDKASPVVTLHGQINNTATATGRSSSSDPNLQNLTSKEKSQIKKAFISRWGKDGFIVEADYKQLEIVALAYLTGCKQLKKDINSGLDVHSELFEQMYRRTPTDEERKNFKRRSFALIYGASANSIAEQCGCTVREAKEFIVTWGKRYPETLTFRNALKTTCEAYGEDDGHDVETRLPRKAYKYMTPTGRLLKFRQYFTEWMKRMSYSPTQIANYPIQSFATADIVQTVLGVLFRQIFLNDTLREKCLLINTVHDSILFDIHKDVLEEALNLIRNTMSNVASILNNTYNINDFDVKIVVNITKGLNWYDQEPVNEES